MRAKYPSTCHFTWSPGVHRDDTVLSVASQRALLQRVTVTTEKADGENSSLYRNGFHARSLDSRHHESRDWLARFHASIAHEIPDGWRICGENLYAQHSLAYTDLPSYFLGFSVWNEHNICLPWDETLEIFELLGIEPVKVLLPPGVYSEKDLQQLVKTLDLTKQEGYVTCIAEGFAFDDFATSVGKYVRKGHVQTNKHWAHQAIIRNGLAA